MTLIAVDASGRLAELIAIPEPFDAGAARTPTNWGPLFDAAGLQMSAFKPVTPTFNPIVFVDERAAWEGQAERGLRTWSFESRRQPTRASRFRSKSSDRGRARRGPHLPRRRSSIAIVDGISSLVMPGADRGGRRACPKEHQGSVAAIGAARFARRLSRFVASLVSLAARRDTLCRRQSRGRPDSSHELATRCSRPR